MKHEKPENTEGKEDKKDTELWSADDAYIKSYLKNLEKSLDYKFGNRKLLLQALTHSTYAYENKNISAKNNERLEFLGDCVLDLIIGDLLYREHDEYSEGVMSKTRALIVCETTLSRVARTLGLGSYLLLGKGEKQSDGRDKNSNLSNAMESVIAAVYLDGGYEAAYKLIGSLFEIPMQQARKGKIEHDYKSKLLEYVQGKQQQDSIEFKIVREEGPEHKRTFCAQVNYFDMIVGNGMGSTKKEAEQEAAKEALSHIKSVDML